MEQYISQEFPDGASVEAALLRAKSGGAIDIALQNKAPAGYGLGEKQGKRLLATDDLNSITTPGWYWWSTGPSNAPIANACMLVYSAYSGDCYVQEVRVYLPSGYAWWECGAVITRQIYTTYIGEWEWVNPPMILDNEYRTTERYNGKPVYKRAVNIGDITGNGRFTFDSLGATKLLSGELLYKGNLPFTYINGPDLNNSWTRYANVEIMSSKIEVSYFIGSSCGTSKNTVVILRYLKD